MKEAFPRELLEALSRYVEGIHSTEDIQLLERNLQQNPAFRKFFVCYLNLDAGIASQAAIESPEQLTGTVPADVVPFTTAGRADKRGTNSTVPLRKWLSVAAILLITVGVVLVGMLSNPTKEIKAEQLLAEAQHALTLPLERGYRVEVTGTVAYQEDPPQPEQMIVWTHGNRFRVEVANPTEKWAWGREEDGSIWIVANPNRGLKINPDEIGPALKRYSDRFALDWTSLISDLKQGADLKVSSVTAQQKSIRLHGQFRSGYHRSLLVSVDLELDPSSKAIRKATMVRTRPDQQQETSVFTLVEERPMQEDRYHLEGNLVRPFEILDGKAKTGRRRMIIGNRLGGGNHRWLLPGNNP